MNPEHMDNSENSTGASLSPQITRDYKVIRLLGKGGMGDVYLAEQVRVGRRPVALKVLNRSCCENPDLRRRFENEAASAGRIQHPNVVMIYECRATDDGQLYVAMQYVEGTDLSQLIEARGALPLAEIVEITKQAAAGLGAAHKLGIVHRDVKPANIMLTHDDDGKLVVKVLDFGIARLAEPDSTSAQTKTGVILGSPYYMSPEQALGRTGDRIDARSDIYSLAMAVYQMLTGSVAFNSDSWMQVIYKHINEAPVPPSQARPELAGIGPIDRVVLKGLEKDREKRYQTAAEFASELEAAYAGLGPSRPELNRTPSPPAAGTSEQVLLPRGTAEPARRSASTSSSADSTVLATRARARSGSAGRNIAETPGVAAQDPGASRLAADPTASTRPARAEASALPRRVSRKRIAAATFGVILVGLAAGAYILTRSPGTFLQHQPTGTMEPVGPGARTRGQAAEKNERESRQEPAANGTCLGVTVTRGGKPLEGCLLTLTEQASGKSYEARTGPKGRNQFCGLNPGQHVTISVIGPAGRPLGDTSLELHAGFNPVVFDR